MTLAEFEQLIARARRENWRLIRLVDAADDLQPGDRDTAYALMRSAIAEELRIRCRPIGRSVGAR